MKLDLEESNPLLSTDLLPPFARIEARHVRPAVLGRLQEAESKLKDVESSLTAQLKDGGVLEYEDIMPLLEEIYVRQGQPWSYFSHLQSVRNSQELRKIEEELQPKMISFSLRISQSKPIYKALAKLNSSAAFASLPESRQRAVRAELMDRKLSGVALDGSDADMFNKLEKELSELSTNFSNHALDAKAAWNITLYSSDAVKGVPSRALEAAAATAKQAGFKDAALEKGPWVLTLDDPMLGPVLSYAENRSLREQMFRADSTLASAGKFDNTEIVTAILKLRQQKAELLGFKNFDALSLASKMARRQDAVTDLLEQVRVAARPAAKREDDELRTFAAQEGEKDELQKWDLGFYAQKLLKARYDVDKEAMRPYFAYEAAVHGLQSLTQRLFGVSLEAWASEPHVAAVKWSSDVHVYRVTMAKKALGYIMVDPYSRPGEKEGGAWMAPLVSRQLMRDGSLRLPVAAVVANFPKPQGNKPSLLSLDEVSTLFHETGHALQVVLTKQTDGSVSGTSGIEWDAVEIASQFMEYWVNYDRTTLFSMARHYETGEPLPEELYKKLLRAKNFRSATMLLGQVYLAMTDIRLHQGYQEGEDPDKIVKAVGKEVLIHPPLPEARMLCSFGHIFDGGYAAGYYSYLWSEVLSADAFMAFDDAGKLTSLEMPHATEKKISDASGGGLSSVEVLGRRWASTILAEGGGRDPASVFKDFRGHEPSASALLHYSGLDVGLASI